MKEESIISLSRILSIVISRSYPFTFQYVPQSFGRIKFRRVLWKIEKELSSMLPYFSHFLYLWISMDRSIVKYNHCFLFYLKREPVKVIQNSACIDGFLCPKAFILITSGYHVKDFESSFFSDGI